MGKDREWHCAGHWLKCLYDDFLHERVAGKNNPCSSCEIKMHCTSCPPINFTPLMEKAGVKLKVGFNVGERTGCQKILDKH